jgi:hypothetical protein
MQAIAYAVNVIVDIVPHIEVIVRTKQQRYCMTPFGNRMNQLGSPV